MKIINARLRHQSGLHTIEVKEGLIASIVGQSDHFPAIEGDIDAEACLVLPPFVEPHIHLDYALTTGEPRWNMSGTLFEGIECWSERKTTVTYDDIKQRAHQTIAMLRDNGIQHVRTHVDITDPALVALQAMLEVKKEASALVDLQIVAFPQEGIDSFPQGRQLLTHAVEMGADVVGGIPHYENTREQGVASVRFLMELAERYNCLVDVHCDETDDPQSRFLEILAEEALVRGMGDRVTASHTCAMGSYDNAYCSKLFRLLRKSAIHFISCPTESIHLQGRFDTWPKRRGVTRVAELDRAGMNVCFAQDSIMDPWYPLGNGNILRALDAGLHICHMMGYDDLKRCLDFVTDNGARALSLGDNYGIKVGRPANLIILDAEDDYEAVRRQAKVRVSIRKGQIIMQRQPERLIYS